MSSLSAIQIPETCDSLIGLVKRQKKICRKNVEIMDSVKNGANNAISECQFQFRNRRWNCSMVEARNIFGNVLKLGKFIKWNDIFKVYKFTKGVNSSSTYWSKLVPVVCPDVDALSCCQYTKNVDEIVPG